MNPFSYVHASDVADAVARASGGQARFLGGGTNLVDLMRETIEKPSALVDVTGLSTGITETDGGGLRIGAAARNTAVAEHHIVRTRFPALSRADRRRREPANPQHGDDRRQPAPAHPVPLFLRQRRGSL